MVNVQTERKKILLDLHLRYKYDLYCRNDKNKNKYNSDFSWERAVLTKGDYFINATSWRKNMLTSDRNARGFSVTNFKQ
jgi:hypothetical protein